MKKRRTLIISLLLVAALALGIGYAAVTAVQFDIDGRAEVTASDANYHVYFDEEIVAAENAEGEVLSETTASMYALNTLNDVGDEAYVTYKIHNDAASLYDARITSLTIREDAVADGENKYFQIDVVGIDEENPPVLAPGQSMEVTVKVTLLRTALDNKTATIDVSFHAEPVEIVLE